MNQILVTEKLYITPEIKRKKKLYKFEFFISLVVVCVLSSYYIYAEYDRTKSEEVSQEILAEIDNTTINQDDGILRVALEADTQEQNVEIQETESNKYVTQSGATYTTEAVLNIPSLGINYPVLSDTSEELLKISLNKFWGPSPNTVGNYCIVGHNYRNSLFFSNNKKLANGDNIYITDNSGTKIKYVIYNKYETTPEDTDYMLRDTAGKKEISLSTCTDDSSKRLIIWAKEEQEQ